MAIHTFKLVLTILIILFEPVIAAHAETAGGASFSYNIGNHSLSLFVKNGTTSSANLNRVDFTLPMGTTISGTPSGGGTCARSDAQNGFCTFSEAATSRNQLFILINSSGARPAALNLTLTFSDSSTVNVAAMECGAITLSPDTLSDATALSAYSQQFSASGGSAPYTFSLQGVLDAGLTLSQSGLLSGTPSAENSTSFTVLAADANACQGMKGYSLAILPEDPNTPKVDLSISVSPGFYFRDKEDSGYQLFFIVAYKAGVLISNDIVQRDPAGFKPISNGWHRGDYAVIGVRVHNFSSDTSAFYQVQLETEGTLLEGPQYLGYLDDPDSDADENPITAGRPTSIGALKSQELLWAVRFGDVASVKFTASLFGVSPSDTDSSNDSASTIVSLMAADDPSKLKYKPKAKGGADLFGNIAPEPAEAKLPSAAKTPALGAVQLSIGQVKNKKCAWVTSTAGVLQKKPTATACRKPVFLNASGDRTWNVHLKRRLKRGSYQVLVRRYQGDNSERNFSSTLGNYFTLRVK